jgi:hypothetical protein
LTRLAVLVAMSLTFFSLIASSANLGAVLFAGISFIHCVAIFAMSLWRGMGGGSRTDWACFALALLGLAAWQVSGSPLVGMGFAIFADLVAYIPAFIKTWRRPDTESPWLYVGSGLAAALGLLAYPITLASAFQIYIVFCCAGMLTCIYHSSWTGAKDA